MQSVMASGFVPCYYALSVNPRFWNRYNGVWQAKERLKSVHKRPLCTNEHFISLLQRSRECSHFLCKNGNNHHNKAAALDSLETPVTSFSPSCLCILHNLHGVYFVLMAKPFSGRNEGSGHSAFSGQSKKPWNAHIHSSEVSSHFSWEFVHTHTHTHSWYTHTRSIAKGSSRHSPCAYTSPLTAAYLPSRHLSAHLVDPIPWAALSQGGHCEENVLVSL